MRGFGLALAMAWLLAAPGAGAQSVEESYARLCKDEAARKGETCRALREALLAKLQAEAPAPLKSATAGVSSAGLEARFGPLARLAGSRWVAPVAYEGRRLIARIDSSQAGDALLIDLRNDPADGVILAVSGRMPNALELRWVFLTDGKRYEARTPIQLTPPATYTSDWFTTVGEGYRQRVRLSAGADGSFSYDSGSIIDGATYDFPAAATAWNRPSPEEFATIEHEQQALARKEAERRRKDDEATQALLENSRFLSELADKTDRELGLDRSLGEQLVGTLAGAAVVAANGGNAEQILGGGFQGLAATAPADAAATLNQVGTDMMALGNPASPPAGSANVSGPSPAEATASPAPTAASGAAGLTRFEVKGQAAFGLRAVPGYDISGRYLYEGGEPRVDLDRDGSGCFARHQMPCRPMHWWVTANADGTPITKKGPGGQENMLILRFDDDQSFDLIDIGISYGDGRMLILGEREKAR